MRRSRFRSTPPRGRRRAFGFTAKIQHGFDPRLRAGGDDAAAETRRRQQLVSIHASAREATATPRASSSNASRFDPRLRAGGDAAVDHLGCRGRGFDPRLRAGGDAASDVAASVWWMFRSTPPRGRRPAPVPGYALAASVSIHASAREATRDDDCSCRYACVSIHASAREAT